VINDHLSLEALSDYTDELLARGARAAAERHLTSCAACAGELAELRTLLASSRALPDMTPPPDLWNDIRASLVAPTRRPTVTSWWLQRGFLAAAAVLLIVVSSTITAVIMRQRTTVIPETRAAVAVSPTSVSLPASMAAIEAEYVGTAAELAEALAAQRSKLAPATVAKVEASLRVIDDAIAEARRALAEDPANRTLLDIFSANYQQKLQLLRRAAELPAST
jgi:anti-sigma factor RsiW